MNDVSNSLVTVPPSDGGFSHYVGLKVQKRRKKKRVTFEEKSKLENKDIRKN